MRAYPYVVEMLIANENTKESQIKTVTVHAYNVQDAMMQAVIETSQHTGSAQIKVQRIAPPVQCNEPADDLAASISRLFAPITAPNKDKV